MKRDRIEVYRDRTGRWRWRKRARNGEVVSSGQSYSRRYDALRGARRRSHHRRRHG